MTTIYAVACLAVSGGLYYLYTLVYETSGGPTMFGFLLFMSAFLLGDIGAVVLFVELIT